MQFHVKMIDIFRLSRVSRVGLAFKCFMRVFLLLLCLGLMLLPVCGQTPKKAAAKAPSTAVKRASPPTKTTVARTKRPVVKSLDDKKELEKASAVEDPAEKIA